MFNWIQFLGGGLVALLGSKTIEEFFEGFFGGKDTNNDGIPEQTTTGRIAIAIATGLAVALFIEYLKKRKII